MNDSNETNLFDDTTTAESNSWPHGRKTNLPENQITAIRVLNFRK